MPDLSNEFILEHRVEARVARLADRVDFLKHLDEELWFNMGVIFRDLDTIKQQQSEIIEAVNRLERKKTNIAQRLGVFSSHIIKKFKTFENRLDKYEQRVNEITIDMQNLSIN